MGPISSKKKFLPPRGKVSAIALGQTFKGQQWWEMHVSQDSNTYNINILWATIKSRSLEITMDQSPK
jgi:hypothetical protein